ncbi:uncharacterized protein LOC133904407 isoform X2 [Phragmites australis]|uniref:uncharacterized protein LOC133904407 isoform X2 n=1 Tax=Phragmites australis TaxID=29695 RepID=UPI002D7A08F0|nr:uncharacterized protein LOC133904407 isoform X2 [Phragmites australis]
MSDVEDTKKDETTKDAVQAAVPVQECSEAEEESKVAADTSFEITTSAPATESGAAETETETVEAISAEATSAAENLVEKSENPHANMSIPADSTAENAGAKITTETGGIAESETKLLEQPQASPPTMQELPATEEPAGDTIFTAEPESLLHGLTPAEAETISKSEEEDGDKALRSGRADADVEKPVQLIGEAATDGSTLAASDATAGSEDHKEAPKDESAGEIVEALASNLAQAQAASCVTTTISDDANETANAGDKVEELTSEEADEPEAISHPDVTAPVDGVSVGQDTEAIRESDSVGEEPVPVSSTENVQNDEAKPCEGQEGVVEAPNSVEEKISEVEAVQENNNNGSRSDDMPCVAEVAVTPEVVELIKRRTLQGLLMAEKNTEKLAIGDQPTDSTAVSHSMTDQEFDSNNCVEETPDLCKENIAADNSDLVVATTETAKAVEVKDHSIVTEQVVKELVLEDPKSAAEDTKETKSVAERDLGHISNEEEKQGDAHKADSTQAVKSSQRHTINIMSKVKQSIVKVKKVIVGKSPSSKTLTPPVEAGEINLK